ncbi:MAG: hypothetical protein WD709_08115, partial [Gammaproteobacteria bacterium]
QIEPHTGNLAISATRVRIVATGRRGELVKTGGTPRELGRGIVPTAAAATSGSGVNAQLNSIPIKVVST